MNNFNKMSNNTEYIWDRLLEVLEADNLEEMAEELQMNASTLRGRKARNAIPYENIIQYLDTQQLAYVLKGEEFSFKEIKSQVHNQPIINDEKEGEEEAETKDLSQTHSQQSDFEKQLVGLIQRIKDAPFSRQAKIQFVDSLINIAEVNHEKAHNANHRNDSSDS